MNEHEITMDEVEQRIRRIEQIGNAIVEEFIRKEISLNEGLGACIVLLAKEMTRSEIAEKHIPKALLQMCELIKLKLKDKS